MNAQEYQAARGELERLEALLDRDPDNPGEIREIMDALRRDIAAYDQGARGAKPPGGHGR